MIPRIGYYLGFLFLGWLFVSLPAMAGSVDPVERARGLGRDENGYRILVTGRSKRLYLIEDQQVVFSAPVAVGQNGLGKAQEGDRKTPLGDYRIRWMVSRNGPAKANPRGRDSFVLPKRTYCVLDTVLYFGDLADIRVRELPDGTRRISRDGNGRPMTQQELAIAGDEKLWTAAYGGRDIFVMALNYPNARDRAAGRTGSCIAIHGSANLARLGFKRYPGTYGCIALYPADAKKVYHRVHPDTPVRIVDE